VVKDFRLCDTLAEVRARLAQRTAEDDPVFVYTLPQDIHVSAVAREGGTALDDAVYKGFDAPVASRVARIDRCFGEFVGDLRARGLYDESIIIVTSDHGDSLGEEGRVGHAYTLFPEIVRIPLIVRLPSRLAAALVPEDEGLSFSTDLSPTLYALLGQQPAHPRTFFGRPLFRPRGTPPRGPEGAVPVVAASYGAVYGALLDEGTTLYVLDTINLQEHAFALPRAGSASTITPTAELRRAGQRAIRDTVQDIADYFGYRPGAQP
jgi:arylsulfatase A-like enzyme